MTDTKFPDLRQMWLDGDIDSAIGDSEEWFHRCIEDAGLDILLVTNHQYHYWFMKWFGQFMEKEP